MGVEYLGGEEREEGLGVVLGMVFQRIGCFSGIGGC